MPRRWTTEEESEKRQELIELYLNRNKTIKEVGNILNITGNTVFDRMQRLGIPAMPERKKGFCNKQQGVILPDYSAKLAEFVGIMLGDGHLSSGQIWIYINSETDRQYLPYVKELAKTLFGIDLRCSLPKKGKVIDVFFGSVDLVQYLQKIGLTATNKVKDQADVPPWISQKDSYKRAFLRGFFDTDGSIYLLKYGVQMGFCNRSIPLLISTMRMLIDLQYSPSHVSYYKVYVTKRKQLQRYIKDIGFGNPKHLERAERFGVTGVRSPIGGGSGL